MMKILIVDDALDIRLIISKSLTKLGNDVSVAVDGLEALEMIENHDFDVVVSDWIMPNLDGIELCKKVRQLPTKKYIYFILLTGLSSKDDLIKGLVSGADDFLTKPINFAELNVRVNSAKRIIDFEKSLRDKNKELDLLNLQLNENHDSIMHDLNSASIVQQGLLPQPLSSNKLSISWYYRPASVIGGDSFNYFSLSEDLLVYFSVDVSGHGISAALVSISLHNMVSSLIMLKDVINYRDCIPELLSLKVAQLNTEFTKIHNNNHYFTMIFGVVDFLSQELHFIQAGHPQPIYYSDKTKTTSYLDVSGLPVGLIDEAEYETHTLNFDANDKFMLYSDGINELHTKSGEEMDLDNLVKYFDDISHCDSSGMIKEISTSWFDESEIESSPDDLSIVIFDFCRK